MKIYYAHCVALYGTPQERRDVELLERAFDDGERSGVVEVVNPNSPIIERQCERVRALVNARNNLLNKQSGLMDLQATLAEIDRIRPFTDASQAVMELIFKPLAQGCDLLVFRSLPDGRIPAGVAKEIEWAAEKQIPTMELPSNLSSRTMSVTQTREYLREVGNR